MQSDTLPQGETHSHDAAYHSISALIRQHLANARRIVIASHIRPDGDAVGSLLGLGLALQETGKQVQMVLADGVPHNLRHLPGSDQVRRTLEGEYDLAIMVDCSELHRAGGVLGGRTPDINIDHHVTNTGFAAINLVVPEAVATCAILAEFMPQWGLPISRACAAALLTGIVTDTIGFRTSNMTPEALRLAAGLMERGANLPELYTHALITKTFEAARYWGQGLSKLQRDDGLVWTTLSLADRQQAQYPGNDDADLVNVLSAVEGDVAVIFVEQRPDRVKVSWRARPGYDVSKIALQFGGGGHAAAAGADINQPLEIVQQQVLEATRTMLGLQKDAQKA